jgi:hypothetical protein
MFLQKTVVRTTHPHTHTSQTRTNPGLCWYLLTHIEKIRKRTDTAIAFT